MNITNSNQILTKDNFSYFKINAVGFPTGYDAINLPDGMTIYKPDGYIYGIPIKKQTKSSIILAKNQEETIYKIIQLEVIDNAPIALNVPDTVNSSNLKITDIRVNSGDNTTLNLNNILSGYYTANPKNQIISTSKSGSFFSQNFINTKNKLNFYADLNAPSYIELNKYLTGVSGMSIGTNHVLVFFNDGKITGWGDNTNSKALGGNSLTGVIGVAAGVNHSLALLANAKVTGWGSNNNSQALGGNSLTGVIGIAAGANHSLALFGDGKMTGWGDNTSYSQALGGNSLTGVIGIAAGANHSLALFGDGKVTGWGDNTYGQALSGNNLTGVIKISANTNTSVAMLQNKAVTNWGLGDVKSTCVSVSPENPNCDYIDLNCSALNKYQVVIGADSRGCPVYGCIDCPPENIPNCPYNTNIIGYDSLGCPIYECSVCEEQTATIDSNAVDFITFEGAGSINIELTPLVSWASSFPKIIWGDIQPFNIVPAIQLPSNLYGTVNPWVLSNNYFDLIGNLDSVTRQVISINPAGCPVYSPYYTYTLTMDNLRNANLRLLFPASNISAGDKVIFKVKGNIGGSIGNDSASIDTGAWPAGIGLLLIVPSVKGDGCNPSEGVVAGRGAGYCGPGPAPTPAIMIRNGVILSIENHGKIGSGGARGTDNMCCCGEGGPGAGIPPGPRNR